MASAHLDLDLFDESSLRNPFADYRRLRDAGAVVKLSRPDVYAIGRFAEVQEALRRPAEFISGEGVGFSDAFNEPRGKSVLQSDGELHHRMRSVIAKPLSAPQLKEIRSQLKELIKSHVAQIPRGREFDAMVELSRFLPLQAIAHFVGLKPEGRERMLEWAAALFNAIGPVQDKADLQALAEARSYMAGMNASKVGHGSWAFELFSAVGRGKLSEAEALGALSAYVFPSLDTTILAKGSLLHNLAANPEQWAMIRADPELTPAAVLESLRYSPVIRWFARVASRDSEIGGTTVPQGARIMLLYGSANRDERHYEDPERFDITRNAQDHLAFGTGPHICAGMHLARVEMEVLLEALVESGCDLWSGAPTVGVNRGLYGYRTLPYRLH